MAHVVNLKTRWLNKAFSEIKLLQNLKWETADVRCRGQHKKIMYLKSIAVMFLWVTFLARSNS